MMKSSGGVSCRDDGPATGEEVCRFQSCSRQLSSDWSRPIVLGGSSLPIASIGSVNANSAGATTAAASAAASSSATASDCPHSVVKVLPSGAEITGQRTAASAAAPTAAAAAALREVTIVCGTARFTMSQESVSAMSSWLGGAVTDADEVVVDADALAFHHLLEAHARPSTIHERNVDSIVELAMRLHFDAVKEQCTRYIADSLSRTSVMHALRLAEEMRLTQLKQKLMDTISVDVFRSLAADVHYRRMGSQLKAELLEKWGSFL